MKLEIFMEKIPYLTPSKILIPSFPRKDFPPLYDTGPNFHSLFNISVPHLS